jgi:hypothetical protein
MTYFEPFLHLFDVKSLESVSIPQFRGIGQQFDHRIEDSANL